MQRVQRVGTRSVRQLRPQIQRQSRRHASDSTGPADHRQTSHGSTNHPTGSPNESFGRGFFICLAAIPASVAIFQYSKQEESSYFTRVIKELYDGNKAKWQTRNDMHTQMMEQAAADRVLFLNEDLRSQGANLQFPENFNTGSPWNVPAGQGNINIDQVIAKYEKEAFEEQEKRLQQLKDDNVPVEKPVKSLVKGSQAST